MKTITTAMEQEPDGIKTIRLSEMIDDWAGLVIYDPPVRRLLSWRTDPPKRPKKNDPLYEEKKEQYREARYLDRLCKNISHLPSVKGMREICPGVEELDMYVWYPENSSVFGQYSTSQEIIDINGQIPNMGEEEMVHLQESTLPHELRHGFQDLKKCFLFRSNPLVADNFMMALAFNRIVEDDASTFSIVVAYERLIVDGDPEPLEVLKKRRLETSVNAYLKAVEKDPEAHWNGQAANAAFKAYLAKGNKRILDKYDTKLCEDFLDAGEPYNTGGSSDPSKQRFFEHYIRPMKRMPYVDRDGKLQERPLYLSGISLKPQNLTRNLTTDVNYWLIQARMRDMSLG